MIEILGERDENQEKASQENSEAAKADLEQRAHQETEKTQAHLEETNKATVSIEKEKADKIKALMEQLNGGGEGLSLESLSKSYSTLKPKIVEAELLRDSTNYPSQEILAKFVELAKTNSISELTITDIITDAK